MLIEAQERLTTPTYKKLEVLANPDPGGVCEASFNINDTIVFAQPIDRISPIPEPTSPIERSIVDFTKDLKGIERINRFFQNGGVVLSEDISNYDLRPAKWAAEEARIAGTIEEFKGYEAEQVEKTLRERYSGAESEIVYLIDDQLRLRNEKHADEPTAIKIARGNVYLRQQGSPDAEREEKELEGFLKVENLLTDPDTSLGTKIMVSSPPSKLEGSIYVKNFVDFYELTENSGKRIVKMIRFATDATYGEGVTDAYLLSHPTVIDSTDQRSVHEIFKERFGRGEDAAEEEDIQTILSKSKERIGFYINTLCNPAATAESIFVAFQAVLNGADVVARRFKGIIETVFKGVTRVFNNMPSFKNIREEVDWLGSLPVELIAAACGTSGGGSLGGIKGVLGSILKGISNAFSGFKERFKSKDGCSKCGRMGVELECGVCNNCCTE